MEVRKVLVSACLMGHPVRYDGKDKHSESLAQILKDYSLEAVAFCPEDMSLGTPRLSANLSGGGGQDVLSGRERVLDISGMDVTKEFLAGAQKALLICQQQAIKLAVLKESSPSCGSSFTHILSSPSTPQKVTGEGVTTSLLRLHGIQVFSEETLPFLLEALTK